MAASRPALRLTRRALARQGAIAGLGLVLAGPHRARAQVATPSATARPGLIDVADVAARRGDPSRAIVGLMPSEPFEAAHLTGAARIDWPDLEVVETSEASLATWRDELGETLGALGIAPERPVVVYDDGTLFAARLWWVLRYLGHDDVTVLDGGLPAWQAAGATVVTGPADLEPLAPYAGTPVPDRLTTLDDVLAALDDPATVIVDARAPGEYADGHIPGAVNVNYPRNAATDPPRHLRPVDELLEMYAEAGVTPDRRVIPYCSSGVRSAVTCHALHVAGFERVALYTGSWQEWSAHPDTPLVTGNTP